MQKVEGKKWLGSNQIGGRKNMSSIKTATMNEMIIEVRRLTKRPLCVH